MTMMMMMMMMMMAMTIVMTAIDEDDPEDDDDDDDDDDDLCTCFRLGGGHTRRIMARPFSNGCAVQSSTQKDGYIDRKLDR